MMDYLEALLGQAGEEEWMAPGRRVILGKRTTVQADDPAEEEKTAEGEGRLLRSGEGGGVPEEELSLKEEAPVGEELEGMDGAARQADLWMAREGGREEGTPLYEALRRTARVARLAAGGRETVTLTLPGETAERQEGDWTALDRAVQRDARRYDGGFTLY